MCQQELDTVNGEFNLKMQKIRLMELELETKIMSDAGERQIREEKWEILQKAMAGFDKVKGKLERKCASLQVDLDRANEQKYLECKEMQETIKDQKK